MGLPIIDLEKTGENIRSLRKSKGLSVKEVQSVFGFNHPQAVYRWEHGDSLPTVDNFVVLSDLLGTSIHDILAIR